MADEHFELVEGNGCFAKQGSMKSLVEIIGGIVGFVAEAQRPPAQARGREGDDGRG